METHEERIGNITESDTEGLLLFFRLKNICSLRLWCFTHHATSSFGISIMVGFVNLLLAYLHTISLLIFYIFFISPSSYLFASFKQEIKKYEIFLIKKLLPEIEYSV